MGAFAVPLLIASTAVSAYGAYKQGQAASKAAKAQGQANMFQAQSDAESLNYNAGVAETNAVVAENNARAIRDQASAKEQSFLRNVSQMRGQARAAAAQSGAGFEGSNADVLHQNDIMAELDALNIRYAGEIEAYGQERTGMNLRSQAGLNRYMASRALAGGAYNMNVANMNADSAMTAGYLNAGSSILSGATNYSLYKGGYFNKSSGFTI